MCNTKKSNVFAKWCDQSNYLSPRPTSANEAITGRRVAIDTVPIRARGTVFCGCTAWKAIPIEAPEKNIWLPVVKLWIGIYDFYWFLVSIEIGLYFSVQFSPCLASHAAHFIKSDESKKGCHGTGHQTWSTLPHVVQVSCDWRNPKEFWPESIELLLEGSMGHCQFRRGQHSRAGQRLRYMIETKEKRNTCFNHFGIQSQQQHDLGTPKTRARTKQLHKLEAQSAHMFKRAC